MKLLILVFALGLCVGILVNEIIVYFRRPSGTLVIKHDLSNGTDEPMLYLDLDKRRRLPPGLDIRDGRLERHGAGRRHVALACRGTTRGERRRQRGGAQRATKAGKCLHVRPAPSRAGTR